FESRQHVTRVPEEGNHLAVDVHLTARLGCQVQNTFENTTKGFPVDLTIHHELRHRRSRIEHREPTGSTGLDGVDAGDLKLVFESLTVGLRSDDDGGFPRSNSP